MSFAEAKFRFVALALAFAGLAVAGSVPPIWIPAVGTPITSWDSGNANDGLKTIYFPSDFQFPLFGVDYTSATVSTNGSIYFGGSPGNSQPQATVTQLLQGLPRLAPAWYNMDLDGTGSVLVSMLPGQAVFTFENVPSYTPPLGQSVAASNLATFQVILDSNGTVIFAYQALNSLSGQINSLVGSQQAIIGVTDGYGAADPGSSDLSALAMSPGFSLNTSSNTLYQVIDNNPPDNSNLSGLDLILTPLAGVGWNVTSAFSSSNGSVLGSSVGAPEPGTLVEMALAAFTLIALWRRKQYQIKE